MKHDKRAFVDDFTSTCAEAIDRTKFLKCLGAVGTGLLGALFAIKPSRADANYCPVFCEASGCGHAACGSCTYSYAGHEVTVVEHQGIGCQYCVYTVGNAC